MSNHLEHDVEIDASGLACPLPLLKLKLGLNNMQSGQVIKLIATDAGSLKDITVFARMIGHELINQQTTEQTFVYWLKKK